MAVIASKREIARYVRENREGMLDKVPYNFRDRPDVPKVPTPYYPAEYGYSVVDWSKVKASTIVKSIRENIDLCSFMGKQLRPWDIVPPSTQLDADKVWVGFEMETGYTNREDFVATVGWFDRNIHRGCYDNEGSGSHPVEFTFYPTHLEDIDKAPITKLIKRAKKITPATHRPNSHVCGSHANVSTPHSRQYGASVSTASTLRAAIFCLSGPQRARFFGRSRIYSGGVHRQPGYYEFKMFNTTYDLKTWAVYCESVRRLTACILLAETAPHLATAAKMKEIIVGGVPSVSQS